MPYKITRRKFLEQSGRSAVIGGTLLTGSTTSASAGANAKVTLGYIGCGNRRKRLIPAFLQLPDVQIAVVCDVHHKRAQIAGEIVERNGGGKPEICGDYRRILDRQDIDAIVIATPEHWKCLPTIHACQAGKDVYVEKPLARTIGEGQIMIKAARKYDRIVMIGTQQRNMLCYHDAVKYIHSGKLGKISAVRAWNFENHAPQGYGNHPDQEPPPELDWNMWLGPAPQAPYNPCRYYGFHFYWDYGGGWQADWGVHMYDIIHWAMKTDTPLSAAASGGKYVTKDRVELPDTFEVVFEYPGFISLYSFRFGNSRLFEGMGYGNAFYGDNGTLVINRDGWRVIPEPTGKLDSQGKMIMRTEAVSGPGSPRAPEHQGKFIEAVKAHKKPEMADVEMGHRSTIPGHLANISYRVGRKVYWDAEKEVFKNDPQANKLIMPDTYRRPWMLEV
ncbi:MAG: Gfo/Idh/MocA family oxidoreductase [Planctomycetota bacterium]|nr:MAG: Gfo/Idh/MocA family oxidoreductase [Planctomycetota bacterium]